VSLHFDLIEQAEHLAHRESKRPRQASLRRAVSATYYAVFHLLIDDAALKLVPNLPTSLRSQVRRAFAHGEMRNACEQFTKSSQVFSRLLAQPIESELQAIAEAFVELQLQRHLADYDLNQTFNRIEVLDLIGLAKSAMAGWSKVRNLPNANVFLTALLLGSRWNR
jgi:uncharacterized protein (UPF0332 family)